MFIAFHNPLLFLLHHSYDLRYLDHPSISDSIDPFISLSIDHSINRSLNQKINK